MFFFCVLFFFFFFSIMSTFRDVRKVAKLDICCLSHCVESCLPYVSGKRKPDPEFYLEALRHLKVEPASCIFIDDRFDCNGNMIRSLYTSNRLSFYTSNRFFLIILIASNIRNLSYIRMVTFLFCC